MANMNQSYNAPPTQRYNEEPVSTGEWMWTSLLMVIPIVNIVLMFVWAFGGSAKPSKRNFFRAALIWAAIGIVLSVITIIALGGLAAILSNIRYY